MGLVKERQTHDELLESNQIDQRRMDQNGISYYKRKRTKYPKNDK